MTKKTGGGSATNSGIDYQQRVAACLQIFLYTQLKISLALNEDFNLVVNSLHFETQDAVDDIKLLCENEQTLYLQVKRSITFSDAKDSEFIKTLDQFIQQYLTRLNGQYFVLVTSADSSRKVTGELRKILTSIRLNDATFKLNPLNKSEKEVYHKFKKAFNSRWTALRGNIPGEAEFTSFASLVYVEIMDVEDGKSLEKSAKILLQSEVQNPDLVWGMLIKNSLVYASNRASVNKKALDKILRDHQAQKQQTMGEDDLDELLRDSIKMTGEYSYHKEALIFESLDQDAYNVWEMPRFDEACSKRLIFTDNKMKIGSEPEFYKILYRGSTGSGLLRFMEQNPDILGDKKLFILDAPAVRTEGHERCIKLYSECIDRLSNQNKKMGNCLHCDKPVGYQQNLLIEIDDQDTPPAVGACHLECRRPMDRVLGTARKDGEGESPLLEHFDLKEWVSLRLKGGILFDGLTPGLRGRAGIAWSGLRHETGGDYCVKFLLEDGTKRFGFHRGRIERFSESDAIRWSEQVKQQIQRQQTENDPIGFTTKNLSFGTYSRLLLGMEADDDFLAIIDAQAVRYSQQEAKLHESGRMYYAPLCYLFNESNDSIFNINDMIPLISEPAKIDTLTKSWKRAGIETEGRSMRTLKSDHEVDVFFMQLFEDGMHPVLDPILGPKGELISGFQIRPADQVKKEIEKQEDDSESEEDLYPVSDPFWQEGEMVEIEIPDESGNEITMFGRVIKDEKETEKGRRVIIFQPIENGEPVEEVFLVIPSIFVSRASE